MEQMCVFTPEDSVVHGDQGGSRRLQCHQPPALLAKQFRTSTDDSSALSGLSDAANQSWCQSECD